jgi:hypothetical protein
MVHRLLLSLSLLSLLLGAACTPAPTEPPTQAPGPYGLIEPFLSAWRNAGAERVGPPLSPPLWIDDYQVQFFNDLLITAIDYRRAEAEPLPGGWEASYPPDLLNRAAAPQRATISVSDIHDQAAQPLRTISITLRIVGYDGPAELHLFDARMQPAGSVMLSIEAGQGQTSILPRGALGPQWAVALVDGAVAGAAGTLFVLEAETSLETGQADLDALYPRLRGFMQGAAISYELDGVQIHGYRSPDNPLLWLRDHVYQGRGFRYFEADVTSALDAFRAAQLPDGSLPDVIDYPERFVRAFRKEVEADIEFLYVQGVYEAWQVTGNDAWLRGHLEPMRRAIAYITSDPLRWDAERGLVRRPYTIDMWDFAYGPTTLSPDGKPAPRHWIEEDSIWGTFHGDNTGLAHALRLMATMEAAVGEPDQAEQWKDQARAIMRRLNELSWNGRFFTHFVPENPGFRPVGVDPEEQLSLSNAYALNRDVLDERQGRAIVESYFSRRDFEQAFAEWYSIDPPFPLGSYGMAGRRGERPGEYVNGGIMPLVGGELARGAFRYGAEPYGLDILRRYTALTELTGASYLWYYPDGRPGISGPDTIGTDGWGAAAMINALFEGLAGVVDDSSSYRQVILSPRWTVDPTFSTVHVVTRYGASEDYVAYRWERHANRIDMQITGSAESMFLRVLLPAEFKTATEVQINGAPVTFRVEKVGSGRYVTFPVDSGDAQITLELPG